MRGSATPPRWACLPVLRDLPRAFRGSAFSRPDPARWRAREHGVVAVVGDRVRLNVSLGSICVDLTVGQRFPVYSRCDIGFAREFHSGGPGVLRMLLRVFVMRHWSDRSACLSRPMQRSPIQLFTKAPRRIINDTALQNRYERLQSFLR